MSHNYDLASLTYHIGGLVVELSLVGEPCHRSVERIRRITLRTVLYIAIIISKSCPSNVVLYIVCYLQYEIDESQTEAFASSREKGNGGV